MKAGWSLLVLAAVILALPSYGQTLSSGREVLALSWDVSGTLKVSNVWPAGCYSRVCYTAATTVVRCTNVFTEVIVCRTNTVPILSCVTNYVTVVRCATNQLGNVVCFTNTVPRLECTTNGVQELVRCHTNNIAMPDCFTNIVTELVCTNHYGTDATVLLRQTLSGQLKPRADCDEIGLRLPATTELRMTLSSTLRRSDWRGLQTGTFQLLVGSNVVAAGTVIGTFGSTPQDRNCAACNWFEGTLRGSGRLGTPLQGWRLQATYVGRLVDVTCPSAEPPQGAVEMAVDGVALVPCGPIILPQQ